MAKKSMKTEPLKKKFGAIWKLRGTFCAGAWHLIERCHFHILGTIFLQSYLLVPRMWTFFCFHADHSGEWKLGGIGWGGGEAAYGPLSTLISTHFSPHHNTPLGHLVPQNCTFSVFEPRFWGLNWKPLKVGSDGMCVCVCVLFWLWTLQNWSWWGFEPRCGCGTHKWAWWRSLELKIVFCNLAGYILVWLTYEFGASVGLISESYR